MSDSTSQLISTAVEAQRTQCTRALASIGTVLFLLACLPAVAVAQDGDDEEPAFCSLQAQSLRNSCGADTTDDFWEAKAICLNVPEEEEREGCLDDVADERVENRQLCRDQLEAREDLCGELGEEPYAPEIDPANFVPDPLTIGSTVQPNTYFPLIPGTRWVYASEEDGETITVEVTNTVKEIVGVSTIVVRDVVVITNTGERIEDTDDYYAQDLDGNVWYFGEISQNFEEGDLDNLDGSWKTGKDGAQPGIIMFANPQVGTVYRQEYAIAEAEDAGRIISITASGETDVVSCASDCVLTEDFTPIEPDALEQKVYAPNVGVVLEIDPEAGETLVELIEFSTP